MNLDEVIQILNANLPSPLSHLQEFILRSSWEGKTYIMMSNEAYYGAEHLRKVASELWSLLSNYWQEPISKTNLRQYLEPINLTNSQQKLLEKYCQNQKVNMYIEFPSSVIPLNSYLYIERPPIEDLAYSEITQPGSIIRIRAPQKMGKSSLMLRILDRSKYLGYHVVNIDFRQAEKPTFSSIDKFLRWFCANITKQLSIESMLDKYWDEIFGSQISCTTYFQDYLLEQVETPVVLALNEVNRLFNYPEIAEDFLPLLRFWYEKAKQEEIWQKLRMIVVYSTEIYIPLKIYQSPFNIGLPLKLPPFSLEQIQDLVQRHRLSWLQETHCQQLMAIVGGHPYLVQLALYYLHRGELRFKQLLEEAPTEAGIYNNHLRKLLAILEQEEKLKAAFKKVVTTQDGVDIDPIIAYELDSMGLITISKDLVRPSCELYRLYFQKQLSRYV
ncbi:MAG: AAA-like domain-containing protein [Trichodesmium sp. MO_231.B1]|nr:AAA-like domain-containing protein [Trichodesmium sp. MO_231.B1]